MFRIRNQDQDQRRPEKKKKVRNSCLEERNVFSQGLLASVAFLERRGNVKTFDKISNIINDVKCTLFST